MKLKLLPFLLLLTFLFIDTGCEAPRNNINDPLNPDYNFGTIEGVVQSVGIPSVGISNVSVIWQNANLIAETDINGRFRLNNIPINNGNLVFSKDGYKADTLQVVWGTSKRFFTQVFFNRIPTLDSVSIYTIVVNQSGLPAVSSLFVKAWITDLDDDVDTVFVINEALTLKKPLVSQAENYEVSIFESELGGNQIEGTIGLDFSIIAKDKFQNEFIIGDDRITRVINDAITGLQPSTDSIVAIQPVVLRWNEFEAGYHFTYLIELFSNTFPTSMLIHTKENILADSTSYTLPINLSGGRYSWVIWIVDRFQNRSRSIPVNFRIE